MRLALLLLVSLGILIAAFVEWVLLAPMAGWAYAICIALAAIALLHRAPLRSQRARLAGLALLAAFLATLYSVPWSSRKPFLRDLAKVREGMTVSEVRQVMAVYREGTGWPAIPARASLTPPTNPREPGRHGELKLPVSLVFRHSEEPRFNSDWGIVSFDGGRVVEVKFSAD